jgi:uncharacterized damage-inducible protein DinB
MHVEDRLEILSNLKSGRAVLAEVLANVSEDAARRSPGEGRWSVLECVEHVAIAEEYLFNQISNAKRSEVPMINIAREAAILERGANRKRRVESPAEARPCNRFSTLEEAFGHFEATRKKTIQFVEDCLDDPRSMLAHHPIIGTANNYEMLLMMALHPHRHAGQIREILSAVATPP